MGEALIRGAGDDDATAMARILRAAIGAAMPWLPVIHTPEEDLAYFRRVVASAAAYVSEVDDEVVGFAVVDRDGRMLDHLYLEPGLRRRGLGTALLTHARHEHPGELELWCFRDNLAGRAFYAAQGAVELYETDGRDNEERTPDVRLRLPALPQ